MRALLPISAAVVAWAVGVCTGIVLMARHEIPAAPMPDPPRWERSV